MEPSFQTDGYQYGIQMDAGSSHTSIFVYKWKARVFHSLPPTLTEIIDPPLLENESDTPISSYAQNPNDVAKSIQPLLDTATTRLRKAGVTDLSTVPVFLGATAGMRMLTPEKVTLILSQIRLTVKKAGFMYKPEWIRVLSGEEEGAFGWLSANWLMGTFDGPTTSAYGALDLGGASTQATFHPDESILDGFFPLNVGRQYHELYTHSYLYYGNNEARYRFLDNLVDTAKNESTSVSNPCFPRGYSVKGATPHHPDIEFKGTGDWEICWFKMNILITDQQPSSENCFHSSHKRCTFAGAYMPAIPPHKDFLAVSTFYFAWKFFELETGSDRRSSDLNALISKASKVCTMSKEEFDAYCIKVHGKVQPAFDYTMCTTAAYIHELLHVGYDLPTGNTPIRVAKKVNGADPGWAFGAMLYEINRLKWSYSKPDSNPNSLQMPLTIVSIFLGVMSVIAAVTTIMLVRRGGFCSRDQVRASEIDTYDRF